MLCRRAREYSHCSEQRLNGQQLGLPGSQVLEAEVVLVDGGSGDLLGFLLAQVETRWAKSGGSAQERAGGANVYRGEDSVQRKGIVHIGSL